MFLDAYNFDEKTTQNIRKMLKIGKVPDKIFMRPEISKELVKLEKIFIEKV